MRCRGPPRAHDGWPTRGVALAPAGLRLVDGLELPHTVAALWLLAPATGHTSASQETKARITRARPSSPAPVELTYRPEISCDRKISAGFATRRFLPAIQPCSEGRQPSATPLGHLLSPLATSLEQRSKFTEQP